MTYRVIQFATGELGRHTVSGIVGHPELDLVGAWVHSEEKAGRDVGELCGLEPLGVPASRDSDALLAMSADCVCYTAGGDMTWMQDPMGTVAELARVLRAGKNIVNSAWPALVYAPAVSDEVYIQLQDACLDSGTSIYTSGIDPGYCSLGLALTALNVTSEVRSVRATEIANYGGWNNAEVTTLMGFGQPDADKCPLLMPGLTSGIFGSTLHLLADGMGVQLDEIVEDHELIHAEEAFDLPAAHIAAGTISGMRFEVKGMIDGEARVVVEHVTKLRDDQFPAIGFEGTGYRVAVDGEPRIQLDMKMSSPNGDRMHASYVACAMALVNAIPQVCDAPPGVLSILDLRPHPSRNVPR